MSARWPQKLALVFFICLCVAALILPATAIQLKDAFAPFSWRYPLGATPLGQSVAILIIAGAGQTLAIAALALVFSLGVSLALTGVTYILPAPFLRAYMFFTDAWLSIPGIFIALSIGYFLPQGFFSVMIALILSEFASLQKFFLQRLADVRKSDYITMSAIMGAGPWHMLVHHVFPRLSREAGYLFFLSLPSIVLSLASLEFLGVQTGSERLSLGMQIAVYKDYILLYPHLSLAPVICLLALLFSLTEGAKVFARRA